MFLFYGVVVVVVVEGAAVVVVVVVAPLITISNSASAVAPYVSVARTVNVAVAGLPDGVPLITPVAESNSNPSGNAPSIILHS